MNYEAFVYRQGQLSSVSGEWFDSTKPSIVYCFLTFSLFIF